MNKTKIKIGIDEAGRGPWCGPVVACALAFNSNNKPDKDCISLLNDSKKVTQKKREKLYEKLIELSQNGKLYFGVGVVDNFVIDKKNIRQANCEAMRRAIVEIQRKIPKEFTEVSVVVDGKDNYEFEELAEKPLYIIGGDAKISEISAASIIAKVFRDKLMCQYATLYPHLGLETNAGYGTKKHKNNLENKSDITGIHRTSFKPIKAVLEKKEKVLVHICCGPDATVPLMDLKQEYEVIAYWYDPNIQPKSEYIKRYEAFVKVCEIEGVEYIEGEYDVKNFFKRIKGMEDTPERGEKCTHCYDMRLERSARLAREMGITKWTSSLNNSPHKDMEKMFDLGTKWDARTTKQQYLTNDERQQASKILGVSVETLLENGDKSEQDIENKTKKKNLDFLKIAFRKNGGFQRSVDYTAKHDIFRQNYCGCVYSDTFPGREKKGVKKGFNG
ncbi:ribonuclease HII [Candidatus Gracilibacteria bacterium]|nr:ribonuclease HII [Candidatus Gracilibacteria bacterium]